MRVEPIIVKKTILLDYDHVGRRRSYDITDTVNVPFDQI